MTFAPPRGNAGRTSLGAVGGARGVGAGALRLIIEFLTSFNPEAVKQLEAELQRLTGLQKQANADLAAMEQTRVALQDKVNAGKQAALGLDRKQVEQINQLGAKYANIGKLQGTQLQQAIAARNAEVQAIAQATGLDEKDILYLSQKKVLQSQIEEALDREVVKRKEISDINRDLRSTQGQLNNAQSITPGGLGKGLASLGIGAIGAAAGFAVLGPILAGVSDWMDKVVKSLEDMVDPSRQAAEALKSVAEQVDQVASADKISRLQAAQKIIADIRTPTGDALTSPGFTDEDTARAAELASLNGQIAANLKTQLDLMKAQADSTLVVRQNAADILAFQYKQAGIPNPFDPLVVTTKALSFNFVDLVGNQQTFNQQLDAIINKTLTLSQEEQRRKDILAQQEAILRQQQTDLSSLLQEALSSNVTNASNSVIDHLNAGLNTTLDLYSQVEDATVKGIQRAQENTINGIQARSESRLKGLQERLDALSHVGPSAKTRQLQQALTDLSNRGPSQHTKDLQKALEQLSKAEEERAYKAKLADIAEERRQIILRHQLENAKTAIDITKYQGRERLIALDAELARQQRANAAQERYNKLLSIQYEFTRKLTRQQGETIQEFQERQAQKNRDLLEQAAQLRQQDTEDSLNEQKDKIQYQLDLEENAKKKRDAIRSEELKRQQQALQKSLQQSQAHDKAVLEAQKNALQKRLKASQEADQLELERRRKVIQNEMEAVRQQAQSDIQAARNTAQARIDQVHRAYDNLKKQTQESVQSQIDAERTRAQEIVRFANAAEVARLQSGIAGAHNIQELNTIAGYLAGANFSEAYIKAQLQAMGVDPYTQSILLGNIANTRAQYNSRLGQLQNNLPGLGLADWIPGHGPGHAAGGFVELKNSMNFGNNGHFGESGPEIGFVLTNSLSKMFKESRQEPLVGSINFNGRENPSRDAYYLKRTIREVVREEFQK